MAVTTRVPTSVHRQRLLPHQNSVPMEKSQWFMREVFVMPNVELSGRQQRDVLDSERKMGRKALRSMAGAPRCWRSA